ncbi:CAP domain-containing protein [Paenibacillus woosongensis]|uniref:SCP-like extracellular n=1 Tax=Paenibacillus woosongensis TaxID=307580 RepID=A0A7X3CLM6_9BACL|nr:CAP domain-containing protein [Paenibacillus woosongensis]MUG43814.1 SCP-like extracellular [Paenibacillus woosongensis]
MKNKHFKTLVTTSMATAVLAAGLVLPQGAKAEAASTPSVDCNQQYQQIQQILSKWNWNGSLDDLKWVIPNWPTVGTEQPQKETPAIPTPSVPDQKPATPSAPVQKPTAPSTKPTAPSQKPSTGSDANAGNGTTTKPTAPTAPSKDNNANAGQSDASSFAAQVVDLVNQERAKAGLKPLTTQADLTKVAAAKAADMRQNGYFDHQSPTYGSPFDMMKQFGVSYSYAGENIAKGQRTPAEVMNAWMNSEGHRQNIMNPNFTAIGVAYDNGYWVQEFIGK